MHLPVVWKAERKVAPRAKPKNEGGSKMSGPEGERIPLFAPSFAPAEAPANVLSYRGSLRFTPGYLLPLPGQHSHFPPPCRLLRGDRQNLLFVIWEITHNTSQIANNYFLSA